MENLLKPSFPSAVIGTDVKVAIRALLSSITVTESGFGNWDTFCNVCSLVGLNPLETINDNEEARIEVPVFIFSSHLFS